MVITINIPKGTVLKKLSPFAANLLLQLTRKGALALIMGTKGAFFYGNSGGQLMRATLILGLALLFPALANATTISVPADTTLIGDAIENGDIIWPGNLQIEFSDDFQSAEVTFVLTANWSMTDDGMTSLTERFFNDGDAQIAIEMNPLSELNDETVANITNVELDWFPDTLNNEAPTTFINMSGQPIPVSEPSTFSLIAMASVLGGLFLARSVYA